MDWKPQTLAQLAQVSGFTMADVAFLAGLEESTVSRLWETPDWLDRIKGRSLQALISVLPGVAEYVYRHSLISRRARLIEELSGQGLEVNEEILRRLVVDERVPEQYLGNALEAAIHIMRNDTRMSAAHLMRFWGRMQDFALGYLYESASGKGVLKDPKPLVEASLRVARSLEDRSNSFHALMAQASLAHYIARAPGQILPRQVPAERQNALAYRSAVIGQIIQNNDFGVATAYAQAVGKSSLLALIEDWAFPTYSNDARATSDFSLPRSLLLKQTADEVLEEIGNYNDAYVYYLVKVYLPVALRRDPTFGLRLAELKSALIKRIQVCESDVTRHACQTFVDGLGQDKKVGNGARIFGDAW